MDGKLKHNHHQDAGLKAVLHIVGSGGKTQRILSRTELLAPMFCSLTLKMDAEELTEQETALYDRQIRVWGADSQRRLIKSNILVCGIKGTVAEFCKNIVLAGVGSLTLVDDRVVAKEALSANFLIPPDESVFGGKTIAEVCCDSVKEFNPMVRVSVEKGDFSSFGLEFYDKFDVVVVSCCSFTTKKLINEKCRKSSKHVAFFTVDCRDSCGEIFIDLQNHKYSKQKLDETVMCQLQYPSFEEAISVPWRVLITRKVSKLYFAMRVIELFEEAEGSSREISIDDLPGVLNLKRELCEADSLHVPDTLPERLITSAREFPPVCAILGGILGQEVIKAISGKEAPLKNFFFFDAMDGKGIVEDISLSSPNIGS